MTEQLLELKIIDRVKKESSQPKKRIVWGALIAFFSLILYFPINIEIKGILVLVAAIFAPLCIYYVFISPSKGTISLEKDKINLQIGNRKSFISLSNQTIIKFYQPPSIEGGSFYFIEFLDSNKKKFLLELDIVFSKEKELLAYMKETWSKNGVNVETKKTPPNSGS